MGTKDARQTLAIVAVLMFSLGSKLGARTELPDDTATRVTTIVGPQESEVRAITVGGGTAWILGKHELLRVDPGKNQLTPVIIEIVEGNLRSRLSVGGDAVWILGDAHA